MAPLYSYSKDDTDQVGAFKKARKYPLYVPLLNKLIFNYFICVTKKDKDDPDRTSRWENDPICLQKEPRFPLTATAAMRMQTAAYEDGRFATKQGAGK